MSDGTSDADGPRARERLLVAGLELEWRELAPAADGRSLGLWVLCDPDVLLDQITEVEYYAHDERMPYFGAIWPSAESLVARLLADPPLAAGGAPLEVLDLGCGLGACGFAAARRGARVTFMDWEPRALEIVEASALAQGLPLSTFEFIVADWRRPPKLGRFDRVLGADVLYEERNAEPVAAFLAAHLAPGAEAWISDPQRPHARRFPALAQNAGLEFLGGRILPRKSHGLEITLMQVRKPA